MLFFSTQIDCAKAFAFALQTLQLALHGFRFRQFVFVFDAGLFEGHVGLAFKVFANTGLNFLATFASGSNALLGTGGYLFGLRQCI